MYYKRSMGAILVRKSSGNLSWVKWVHHVEGKHIAQSVLN